MKKKEKKDRFGKLEWFIVGSILTVVGFLVIPSLIQKYGNKAYKKSLNIDDIDFDEMEPEIVPFDNETKENK